MIASASDYRPDIDGLRAVAVLSVLLFHAKFEFLSGGYIGVDVFFVISGYLITSIIAKQITQGEFSVLGFYERRFRRLLPALFVVIVVTVLIGAVILHPRDLVDLSQSVLATALFSSNILFNFEAGYFDGPAEFKPLLHTWSLAVEEQYYVLFPIALVLIAKYSNFSIQKWILSLFVLSFLLCVVGTRIDPTAAFYLLPTRAWELLAGSLIAVKALPTVNSRALREVFAFAGLASILICLVSFTPHTPFPGYAAALPVIGTMLLLYSGENSATKTIIANILSVKQFVFIGLISYSLYLWHWPILVYTNYATASELNSVQLGLAMGLIFLLAWLSWKYVEMPFRRKNIFARRNTLLAASGIASLLMVGFGAILIVAEGWPNRYAFASSTFNSDSVEWDRWGECQTDMKNRLSGVSALCDIGNATDEPAFLFWGDSHARSLAPAVELSATEQNINGVIATKTACPPLLGIDRDGQTSCATFNDQVIAYLQSNSDIKTVILSARWNLLFTGESYKEEPDIVVTLTDIESQNSSQVTNKMHLERGLRRTIKNLIELDKSVIVVNQIPEVGFDVPRIDFISRIFSASLDKKISPTVTEFLSRSSGAHSILNLISEEFGIELLDPSEYLCTEDICHVTSNGTTLYLDDDHLSISGSRYIARMFDMSLGKLK